MEYNSKSNLMSTFRRIMLALMLVMALPFYGIAQNVISGTVTDEQGDPLIGVSVLVKETKAGVSTDIDGKYSVRATKGQTVVFSYIGMVAQEIKVGASRTIDVVMEPTAESLDEVVVVGYGKQKKSSITGAVSAIKGD